MRSYLKMAGSRLAIMFIISLSAGASAIAQHIDLIAGTGTYGYSGDGGAATAAHLYAPVCIVPDRHGNQYISDKSNYRIRKVSATGVITTIAGTGSAGYSGDGGPATAAAINTTAGIALDTFDNLYIADEGNNRIRKVSASGIISTIAGNGTSGFSGDGGPATAATISLPEDVVIDPAGNMFIADYGNSRIRLVNTSGIISTVAGVSSYGSSGDGGPATAAQVVPYRLALDAAGNLYEAEFWANRIRMINTAGIINTVIGNGSGGYSGDGGPATAATIDGPYGIAVDKYGDIFVNDQNNRRIRKVNVYGIISTYAGTGTFGYSGDGGQATAAKLGDTRNVAVNDTGDIFMADITFHRCRVIRNTNHYPAFTGGLHDTVSVCENSSVSVNSALRVDDMDTAQAELWSALSAPLHGSLTGLSYMATSTGGTIAPAGISYTPVAGYVGADSFRVKILDGMLADTITVIVTVKPYADAGTITGSAAVCLFGTTMLTESVAGGTWRVANGNTSVTGSGLVSGINNGVDTIWYVYTNGCGLDSVSHSVTVETRLDLGSITGPDSVCPGHVVLLTHSYPGGVWVSSDTSVALSAGAGVIYGVTPGITTIMYIVVNSCAADTVWFRNFQVSADPACITLISQISPDAPLLSILPNSSSGNCKISCSTLLTENVNIYITDMAGKLVTSFAITPGSEKQLQLQIAPGFYLIDANSKEMHTCQKLVITH